MRTKLFFGIALLFATCFVLSGCTRFVADVVDKSTTVTLLNGEHYKVNGNNKVDIKKKGESVTFSIKVDDGYMIIGAQGGVCTYSDNFMGTQTITINDVNYKQSIALQTKKIEQNDLVVNYTDNGFGSIRLDATLGGAYANTFYNTAVLTATAELGYEFWGWSKNDYILNGGTITNDSVTLAGSQLVNIGSIFANFKTISPLQYNIYYHFDSDTILRQDATKLLEHHYLANTYTAVDIRAEGIDCDSRLLAGWQTQDGEYIGLGSRVEVKKGIPTNLTPIWKDYTSESNFEVDNTGKLTKYITSESTNEVVIPRTVNGVKVTSIGANAFENSQASTYYLPDSITTVEDNAFLNCTSLTDFYMSDNIMTIGDASFTGCNNFTTLHMNAYLKPRYIDSPYALKTDIYDKLFINSSSKNRKLIILAGSSSYYGYSVSTMNNMLAEKFIDDISIYHLGIHVNYSAFMQYEMMKDYLKEDDIMLHASEPSVYSMWFANISKSPLTDQLQCSLDQNITMYLFENNYKYLSNLTVNLYSDLFNAFENFNKTRVTLIEKDYWQTVHIMSSDEDYGITIDGEIKKKQQNVDLSLNESFKRKFTDVSVSVELAINSYYQEMLNKGIDIFVTFAPINRHNLLLTYNDEKTLKDAAINYTKSIEAIINRPGVNILLSQYDTVYDGKYFADSDLHLGHPFRDTHTANVINAMIPYLNGEK